MALLRHIGIVINHVIDVATLSMFDQLSKGKMEVDSDLEFCMSEDFFIMMSKK